MKRNTLIKAVAFCSSFSVLLGLAAIKTQAFAQDTQPTYQSVADLSLAMEDGAWVRSAATLDQAGIRFKMTMPESAHTWLMENTGEDKLYSQVTFGMFIAPQYYHNLKPMNVEGNVLGQDRVYGWLKDGETIWTQSADYTANNSLVQILNTQGTMIQDGEVYSYYGAAIGMEETKLTTEYVVVGYVCYTQGNETHYQFATAADNARSITYVTQCAVENGALKESVAADKAIIDAYVGAVEEQDTTYTVEYYAPNGSLLKTEDKTSKINEKITVTADKLSTIQGYVFNERSNPELWKVVSDFDQAQDTAIEQLVYANGKTVIKVNLDDAVLYDFEEFTNSTDATDKNSLTYVSNHHISNNGNAMSIAETLPAPFTGKGLQFTFNTDWQQIPFYNWTGEKLSRAIAAGYTYLKMDVYYQGAAGTAWITPFGLAAKSVKANSWTTVSFPLLASGFGTYPRSIIFNMGNQANYTVYVDNIRLGTDTTSTYEYLYNGFESDTAASKYVTWYSQTVSVEQTDVVKAGTKSLKVVFTSAYSYIKLRDGSGNQLDNAWIKARAGKTLSFWVYYKNDTLTTDGMWLTVNNNAAAPNAYQKLHTQGEWVNVVIDLDNIQDFTDITLIVNSNNIMSGAVYFDHFEVY